MLSPGTIAIWRLGPSALEPLHTLPAAVLAAAQSILSSEEQRRASAFHAEEHRREYIAAHAALRTVLARLTGLCPQSVAISAENGAKPALAVNPRNLHFNLSHTRLGILIAASVAIEIGVDLEWHRPIDDLGATAQAVMSPAELLAWNALAPQPRVHAFYNLWTRKEAYLKAIGLGLFRDLHSVSVPATPEFLSRPAHVEDRAEAPALWSLLDLPVWSGFSAALSWQGSSHPQLTLHDLSLAEILIPG